VLLNKTTLNTEGIGLSNIKRRLELLYPHKYNLEINNQEGYFEVKLELILDEN
jgi:LytS/YehU family sensor histidine kinase